MAEDARFRREGLDVVTRVAVPVTDAMVGATVTVPTVEGEADVELRPGTQPGDEYVLRGKGFPALAGRGRGDQRVVVEVRVPRVQTEDGRRAVEAWPTQLDARAYREDEGFFDRLKPPSADPGRLVRLTRDRPRGGRRAGGRRGVRRARHRVPRGASAPAGEAVLDFWVAGRAADPDGLRALLGGAGIAARVEALPQDDAWRDALAAFHQPVEIAGRLLVRPPWAPARPPLLDVEIDPGMAFGTGQHATTRACLTLLAERRGRARRRLAPGRRLRLGGAGDRRPAAGLRPRLGGRRRPALRRGDPRERPPQRRGPAGGPAHDRRRPRCRRPPSWPPTSPAGCCGSWPPRCPSRRRGRWWRRGIRPEEAPGVEAAVAARGLRIARRLDHDGWTTLLLVR